MGEAGCCGETGCRSNPTAISVPVGYRDGYERARAQYPDLSDAYVRHTTVGDPLADSVVDDLSSLDQGQVHALLAKVLQDPENLPADSPQSLRRFIAEALVVPDWFDEEIAMVASRAFLRNSDTVLAALVGGSIIEGFATLISKAFRIRGRITHQGVSRLKQNVLQLVEQYLPGGMIPLGDGWKLTLRVRLVHAQSRRLLSSSDEWDQDYYGIPISAASVLLAGSAFSGRLMQHAEALGGDFTAEEREAYVHVWRYTGLLMGIPPEIIFHDEASSVRAFRVGRLCEPPPDEDAIIMANSVINSAPLVIGITDWMARRKLASYAYQVSRGLIGNELSEAFLFPKGRNPVPFRRMLKSTERGLGRVLPRWRRKRDIARFKALLDVNSGKFKHSYRLPSALYEEDSSDW